MNVTCSVTLLYDDIILCLRSSNKSSLLPFPLTLYLSDTHSMHRIRIAGAFRVTGRLRPLSLWRSTTTSFHTSTPRQGTLLNDLRAQLKANRTSVETGLKSTEAVPSVGVGSRAVRSDPLDIPARVPLSGRSFSTDYVGGPLKLVLDAGSSETSFQPSSREREPMVGDLRLHVEWLTKEKVLDGIEIDHRSDQGKYFDRDRFEAATRDDLHSLATETVTSALAPRGRRRFYEAAGYIAVHLFVGAGRWVWVDSGSIAVWLHRRTLNVHSDHEILNLSQQVANLALQCQGMPLRRQQQLWDGVAPSQEIVRSKEGKALQCYFEFPTKARPKAGMIR